MKISELAIRYIKSHKQEIRDRFANDRLCPPSAHPFSIFMAGSIGAGKTEFSQNLIKIPRLQAVRIDADEVKEFIPLYNGKNARLIQGASALGVEYLHDYVLLKKKSMVMDGTMQNFEKAKQNIERSLKKGRSVEIFFIYQDPLLAWRFTKAREHEKGRVVTKKAFLDSFFNSRKTVNKIKEKFGSKIILNLVVKSYEDSMAELHMNITSLDNNLEIESNRSSLEKSL